jgi:hypothetical protein
VAFTPADYAELLGPYLGDGYIGVLPRTQRLRIFLDAKHAMIVSETAELLARTFPHNRVGRLVSRGGGMVVLWIYHQHLSCLFPQVGDGKKHERPIALEPWQDDAVVRAPWAFLRGLIRSDGCVFVNRTGKYEYVSYCFDNMSREIRELFIRTCDQVGVVCRASGRSVRIYQRASVELMRANVGVKS